MKQAREMSFVTKLRNLVLVLGIGLGIIFGFVWLVSKTPEADPVRLARGNSVTIDLVIGSPSMGAKAASFYLPRKTFFDRNWEGYSFEQLEGEEAMYLVFKNSEIDGIEVTVGPGSIRNGVGVGSITVTAFEQTPVGTYKIWLKGAYHDYTRVGIQKRRLKLTDEEIQKGFQVATVVVDVQ